MASVKDIFFENKDTLENNDPTDATVETLIPEIVSTAMYVIGALSVIMLVVGAVYYAMSAGDESKIKRAKQIIIGSIIGLIVAILAWTIVNFVVMKLL